MLNTAADPESGPSVPKRRLHAPLFSLSTYDLHKRLVNNYLLSQRGATTKLQRDSSRDKRDIDVIRENHQFLWDTSDAPDTWEERLAKKYYDKLFKEYCISDLRKYKENKVAMRWRTEQEVVIGKGQFECGEKKCQQKEGLRTWEVNFAYMEKDTKKNALVKLRLCSSCSDKLNYHHNNREITTSKTRKRKREHDQELLTKLQKTNDREVDTEQSGEPNIEAQTSAQQEEEEEGNAWKEGAQSTDEKSRDEEFQSYLEELLF